MTPDHPHTPDAPPGGASAREVSRPAPILLMATLRILPGRLAPFVEAVERSVAFAERHSSPLLVEVFVDEPAMRAHSCQVHPDSASILRHWRAADPYIREVNRHMTPERLDIYGRPSDAVLDGLRPFQEEGLPVTVTPHLCGFSRFAAPP